MCILVVEDDFLIRAILVEDLAEAGYDVRDAATGDEAVALLETMDPPPRLLVTDIHMPGSRSGLDLAAHFQDRLPRAPVIFTTGRPDALRDAQGLGAGRHLVLKPYAPAEIVARAGELLDPAKA